MKSFFLALGLTLAGSVTACGPLPPTDRPALNSGPAVQLVLDVYRSSKPVPPVFMVLPEPGCSPEGFSGFWSHRDGKCVGGLEDGGMIWLVETPDGRYSTGERLPHEVAHYVLDGDPDHRHRWFREWDMVTQATVALAASDLDRVQVGR